MRKFCAIALLALASSAHAGPEMTVTEGVSSDVRSIVVPAENPNVRKAVLTAAVHRVCLREERQITLTNAAYKECAAFAKASIRRR
jgi:hypothetical protein